MAFVQLACLLAAGVEERRGAVVAEPSVVVAQQR